MIEQTLATFGRLDFAFNNAGVEQALTPLPDQTEETYDQIMDINVKGVWLSLKHEIPAMLKTGGGAIVNNSSVAGLIGFATAPVYVASKHAVIGLTKSVALEYAKQHVRINAVAPGAIETRMFRDFASAPEVRQSLESAIPIGRIGQPEEIASTVVWLCSDGASFVTGQISRSMAVTLPSSANNRSKFETTKTNSSKSKGALCDTQSSYTLCHKGIDQVTDTGTNSLPVWFVVIAWAALSFILNVLGVFATSSDKPPLPLLISVIGPPILFAIVYSFSAKVRTLSLSLDLRLLTAMQGMAGYPRDVPCPHVVRLIAWDICVARRDR